MPIGNRVPLCLCMIGGEWRSFQTEVSLRGHLVDSTIFLREPTQYELDSVRASYTPNALERWLQDITVWRYKTSNKAVASEQPRHKQSLTTEDRDGNLCTPTCTYCGKAEEFCTGEK